MDVAWAQPLAAMHFQRAPLGDRRRVQRLMNAAQQILKHPIGSLPQKMEHWAGLMGLYRLLASPQVTHEALLAPHRDLTLARMAEHQGVVLMVHDSSEFGLHLLLGSERGSGTDRQRRWTRVHRPAPNVEQACQLVDFYGCRVVIEEYHKGLKTGLPIESLNLAHADRLEPAIALLSVIGTLLLQLRLAARAADADILQARTLVPLIYVQILSGKVYKQVQKDLSVRQFLLGVARLGGHLGSALIRAGKNPRRFSAAGVLRIIRAAMTSPSQRFGRSGLERALARAGLDDYQRTASKKARHWPHKKPPAHRRTQRAHGHDGGSTVGATI
jgi:hypothetical protein